MIQDMLSASWVTDLLMIVLQVVMALVGVLMLPFSIIIKQFMPNFDEALGKLDIVFDYASQYSGWIVSAFGIPALVISAMIGYYTFVVSTKLAVWGVKIAFKWRKTIF